MSMTKKDYELIAKAISEVIDTAMVRDYTASQSHTQILIIEPFAERLERDNPRFDRKKFIDACFNFNPVEDEFMNPE